MMMKSDQPNAMDIDQENGFIHSPILDNQVFFLCSKCSYCGFIVLAGSVNDLLEQEQQHQGSVCRPTKLSLPYSA